MAFVLCLINVAAVLNQGNGGVNAPRRDPSLPHAKMRNAGGNPPGSRDIDTSGKTGVDCQNSEIEEEEATIADVPGALGLAIPGPQE